MARHVWVPRCIKNAIPWLCYLPGYWKCRICTGTFTCTESLKLHASAVTQSKDGVSFSLNQTHLASTTLSFDLDFGFSWKSCPWGRSVNARKAFREKSCLHAYLPTRTCFLHQFDGVWRQKPLPNEVAMPFIAEIHPFFFSAPPRATVVFILQRTSIQVLFSRPITTVRYYLKFWLFSMSLGQIHETRHRWWVVPKSHKLCGSSAQNSLASCLRLGWLKL